MIAPPMHRRVLARIRLGLLVGPDGPPSLFTIRLRWHLLQRDRKARLAAQSAGGAT